MLHAVALNIQTEKAKIKCRLGGSHNLQTLLWGLTEVERLRTQMNVT